MYHARQLFLIAPLETIAYCDCIALIYLLKSCVPNVASLKPYLSPLPAFP